MIASLTIGKQRSLAECLKNTGRYEKQIRPMEIKTYFCKNKAEK